MFALKKKYFIIIENIKDIELSNIKKLDKFVIIYRNNKLKDKFSDILKFRKKCKEKRIELFVANNVKLLKDIKADGIYISANNFSLNYSQIKKSNFKLIGSAHNSKELTIKKRQGCADIFFSRLFKTNYKHKIGYLGLVRFNLLNIINKNKLIPLGGIRLSNLNKMKLINCSGFVMLSEPKKKPAIFDRLF